MSNNWRRDSNQETSGKPGAVQSWSALTRISRTIWPMPSCGP